MSVVDGSISEFGKISDFDYQGHVIPESFFSGIGCQPFAGVCRAWFDPRE